MTKGAVKKNPLEEISAKIDAWTKAQHPAVECLAVGGQNAVQGALMGGIFTTVNQKLTENAVKQGADMSNPLFGAMMQQVCSRVY